MGSRPTRATLDGHVYLDLQRLARQSRRSSQELLHLYALEGLLARLADSQHASKLVLKGGVLLSAYGTRRATRDVDLQGRRMANDAEGVLRIVQEIATVSIEDGLRFDTDAATSRTIRDDDAYQGIPVSLESRLATARIGFHVDVNVGDPIWPPPQRITLPGLLDRTVELLGYPLAMVYAEKIVTAVHRGPTNTRWRDFADVYTLSGQHTIGGDELHGAVRRVAAHRGVVLAPLTHTLHGWADSAQPKWATWRRKQLLDHIPGQLSEVLAAVIAFADPILSGDTTGAVWDSTHRAWRR